MAKPLKPSQREKKRYIVFEIISSDKFAFEQAKNAIIRNYFKFLGEFGFEKARLYIIKNLYKDNKGILRITNKCVNDIKAVFEKISSIEGIKASFEIKGISGILKKAKNKFL